MELSPGEEVNTGTSSRAAVATQLRPGMSVVDLVDVYRKAGAFNGGRLAEGATCSAA